MARFIVRRLIADGARDVRRLGAHVPDLQRDPERRSGRAHGGPPADRDRRSRRSARSGASTSRVYVQYVTTMKKVFTGDLKSYFTQLNVDEEIRKGLPRTLSLAIGAALLWMAVAVAFGLYSAMRAGKFADRFLTIIALVGISMPVFWIGALMNYYLGFKWGLFPNGGYVEFSEGPGRLGLPPDPALDGAGDAVHRRLLARAALERARHDERGLRAHRARQGPVGAPGDDPPRAAQLDDPDRHALGARLRRRDRRRRDPHRDGLRPPGRGPVRGRLDRPAGRAAGARGHDVRAPSSSCC